MKTGTIYDRVLSPFGTKVLLVVFVLLMWGGPVTATDGEATSVKSFEMKSPTTTLDVASPADAKAMVDIIGPIMDDKLAAVLQKQSVLEKLLLEEKFSGPKMTDIIGGIGWILGLAGIAAFFWSFKKTSGKN